MVQHERCVAGRTRTPTLLAVRCHASRACRRQVPRSSGRVALVGYWYFTRRSDRLVNARCSGHVTESRSQQPESRHACRDRVAPPRCIARASSCAAPPSGTGAGALEPVSGCSISTSPVPVRARSGRPGRGAIRAGLCKGFPCVCFACAYTRIHTRTRTRPAHGHARTPARTRARAPACLHRTRINVCTARASTCAHPLPAYSTRTRKCACACACTPTHTHPGGFARHPDPQTQQRTRTRARTRARAHPGVLPPARAPALAPCPPPPPPLASGAPPLAVCPEHVSTTPSARCSEMHLLFRTRYDQVYASASVGKVCRARN